MIIVGKRIRTFKDLLPGLKLVGIRNFGNSIIIRACGHARLYFDILVLLGVRMLKV